MPSEAAQFRAMWIFALFDLPVDTKELRREYVWFRKALLKEGFVCAGGSSTRRRFFPKYTSIFPNW